MGQEHSLKGPGLEVAQPSSEGEALLSALRSLLHNVRSTNAGERGHSEGQDAEVSRPSFQRPQKRLPREEGHPRPLTTQQVCPVRALQDVHNPTGPDPSSKRGFHGLYRPVRRLLACPGGKEISPVSRVRHRTSGIYFEGNALWPQHRAEGVHEVGKHCRSGAPSAGGQPSRLSRRLVDLGPDPSGMCHVSEEVSRSPKIARVFGQSEEVPPDPSYKIPVAGSGVGLGITHVGPSSVKETGDSQADETVPPPDGSFQTPARENSGLPPICLHHQPSIEGKTEGSGSDLEVPCHIEQTGQDSAFASGLQVDFTTLDTSSSLQSFGPSSSSPPISDYSHRRLSEGMGRYLGGPVCPRILVPARQGISHQYSRIVGDTPDIASVEPPSKSSHSVIRGQFHSGPLHSEGRLKVPPLEPCGASNRYTCPQESLVPVCLSPQWGTQCDCGQPFEGFSDRDRVVLRQSVLPLVDQTLPSTSRPFCDPLQCEDPELCVPLPGCDGNSRGCSCNRLEQMGDNLPVPTNEPPFTSPQQDTPLQGQGNPSSSKLAQCQVVSPAKGASVCAPSPSSSCPIAASKRSEYISLLLLDPPPTRLVFLRESLKGSLSVNNINLLLSDKRESTNNQYQSVWSKWTAYVSEASPTEITSDFCLSFFRKLFEEGTRPSTIASYKSALRDPIWWAFGVDLNGDLFARMLRGCVRLRPASPPRPISWSLHRVLTHLSSIDSRSTTPRLRLGKTLFLLALASGSRLSELVALSRDEGQVFFYDTGLVKLSPDPTFLAKNESPSHRRRPIRIPALSDQYSSLCPVSNLKIYLHSTREVVTGSLFRTHSGGGPLTPAGMRRELVGIIKASNPDSFPKTHDIRKVASSLAFFEDMTFDDLAQYTGWSSPRVFFKRYLKRIGTVPWVCVSAGKVTGPPEDDNDSDE